MLKKLLSTVVTLAVVFCGATIAMEALGLIFLPGRPDPEDRTEAVIAHIEATLDAVDVPSEADGLWPPPEPLPEPLREPLKVAEAPATDAVPPDAAAPDAAPPAAAPPDPVPSAAGLPDDKAPPAIIAAAGGWTPTILAEPDPEADSMPTPAAAEVVPAAAITAGSATATSQQASVAKAALPGKIRRPTGLDRRSIRTAGAASGCPVLGWLIP
jgi:hypothetical protein